MISWGKLPDFFSSQFALQQFKMKARNISLKENFWCGWRLWYQNSIFFGQTALRYLHYLLFVPMELVRTAKIAHHVVHLVSTVNTSLVQRQHIGGEHRRHFCPLATWVTHIPGAVDQPRLKSGKSSTLWMKKKQQQIKYNKNNCFREL